ncbi:alpha/beta hydrolase [Microbacterium sp. 4R-513]|uniref:alpha/beta fold hydrolase n=1 Tax=Microbacterium sp. 4R-513 TaxID=2567934 RepID=UPI0013E11AF9|nr:alpha/beta hydrolase [Microbacterium sp. 4R-513]QIG40041.1 alpha/beta hydrolase [Microbacterium sp. 4R-513]
MPLDVILVPGLWLDGSTWTDVADRLAAAGHSPHPLTLRGLASRTSDRRGIMLADHVAEIVDVIDRADGAVVLVGHAEACGLVHAAVNRRPERIARVIHVGGFPSADGTRVLSASAIDLRTKPVDVVVRDLTDPVLQARYQRISENGAQAIDSVQRLTDERRYSVPTTIVATEYRVDDVLRWVRVGVDLTRELRRMTDLTLVDLPSGRWPQMERADELARLILEQTAPQLTFPTVPTPTIAPATASTATADA